MAGPRTDSTGQIVRQNGASGAGAPAEGGGLVALIGSLKSEIARALPRHLNADRMARITLTALRTTPKLALCTPASFAGCVMSLAQLGLEPNTPLGHAYLIPRDNRKSGTTECTMLIGYQGMIELSRRSGMIDDIYAEVARDVDKFVWQLGTDPRIVHEPASQGRSKATVTHAYAVAFVRGASRPAFKVLDVDDIAARRARSQGASSNYSPWATDYAAMAQKSAVRALWKFLPKSAEMARAEAIDDAVEDGKAIVAALEPEVADVLQQRGLIDTTAETLPEPEPAAQQHAGREPGEEG